MLVRRGDPVKQDVNLEAGKHYTFKISGYTGNPPRFWMQKIDLLGYGDLEAVARNIVGDLTAAVGKHRE